MSYSVFHALRACLAAGLLLLTAASGHAEQKLIEEKNSTYNNIYVYADGPYRILTFGHNRRFYTETIYDSSNELVLPVTYTRFMTVSLPYAREHKKLLEIGFGGGRTAWYLHKHMPQLDITSVELDPVVFDMAIKYFGIKEQPNFKVQIADGRRYLTRSTDTYDVIMIDAYRGPFVPFHLLTTEFFKLVKQKLNPGGVIVQNIEPTTMVFDSALATIKTVFKNIDLYEAEGNVVAVAYDGEQKSQTELMATAAELQKQYKFAYALQPMLPNRKVVKAEIKGKVLSDDFAPVGSLLAIERHNKKLDDISETPVR